MTIDQTTMTCPACGVEQAPSRVWCSACFASFVPEPEPASPGDVEPDAGGETATAPEAVVPAVAPPVIPDIWAAQAPSRMPQILSLAVVLVALALVVLIMVSSRS